MKPFRLITITLLLNAVCIMAKSQDFDGEYVDLGLSVKWCTHNHFPTANSRYGNYYSWPKVMRARTSAGARIPSKAEWQELIDNCVWKWTCQDEVSGYLLTSKVKGYKGNSIFIPAAGYWKDDHVEEASVFGRYWSSTTGPQPGGLTAYSIYFYEGDVRWRTDKKEYGNSYRLVIPLSGKDITGISFEKSKITMQQHTSMRPNVTVSKDTRNVNSACTWSSTDESVVRVMEDGLMVAVGPGKCIVRVEAYGKSAECTVTVKKQDVEFVDLGVGVLWAASNIGADKPSGYGDYFAWAEIEPKESYLMGNYRYTSFRNPYTEEITKYNTESAESNGRTRAGLYVDGKNYLEPIDDVASVMSGGEWCMPTVSDYIELTEKCKSDTVFVDGVKGIRYTSLVPGYEGNSIFLPFGGMMSGNELVGREKSALIWTSNASRTDDVAVRVSESAICVGTEKKNELRYMGLAVRPVIYLEK